MAGSTPLSVIRGLTLGLVLLLLLNPTLPWGAAGLSRGTWILLDRSASMAAAGPGEDAAWSRAVERAERLLPADGRVVLFDVEAEVLPAGEDLAEQRPAGRESRLSRAIELAAEAGVTDVVVVTDMRIQDLATALERADALGVRVGLEDVAEPLTNTGILEVDLPVQVEPNDTFSVGVVVFGEGAGSDSVTVEVRREGTLVGTAAVRHPAQGESERVRIPLPPPGEELPEQSGVRYSVSASLEGDAYGADNQRLAFVRTGDEVGGLILVSDSPDWELRFLLPVLAQVTGLDATGYLNVGSDRWKPVQNHENRDSPLTGEAVARRIGSAELVVVHGTSDRTPAWISDAVGQAGRLILIPGSAEGLSPLGLQGRQPRAGEWYPISPPPASPVAANLADVAFSGLPPLTSVVPLSDDVGRSVLDVRIGAAGAVEPAMILTETSGRRVAVATGLGFWRWALRGGEARTAYRRLWSGVAGWVLGGRQLRSAGDVRPDRSVVTAGEPIRWIAPGRDGQSLSVTLISESGASVDTSAMVLPGEHFRTPPLEAGSYRYQVVDTEAQEGVGSGRLEVEAWSDELLTGPGIPDSLTSAGGGGADRLVAGLRVRTHPLPYLILIALLAIEWIGRRRRGLR